MRVWYTSFSASQEVRVASICTALSSRFTLSKQVPHQAPATAEGAISSAAAVNSTEQFPPVPHVLHRQVETFSS
jgi:hypothetical protein